MDFVVGTFNAATTSLYTLRFTPSSSSSPASITVLHDNPATGPHSWLSRSKDGKQLYATTWSKPKACVTAYSYNETDKSFHIFDSKHVENLPGYVCADERYIYSVGGATGEVFERKSDGKIGEVVQRLDFVTGQGSDGSEKRGAVPHGNFGGLRHGAHSVDLSPDGKTLYVADIGRNCIWTYTVTHSEYRLNAPLKLASKNLAPREHDGPRHTQPHPNGKIIYSLQELTCMVDVFSTGADGATLKHLEGVKIIPEDKDAKDFWADEVTFSTGPDPSKPKYLYGSTRGLQAHTNGYVAVFELNEDGTLVSTTPIHVWETPTSGGIANAVEPAPWGKGEPGVEYLSLTDTQEGFVFVLSFDGKTIKEEARLDLGKTKEGIPKGSVTTVWL